MPEICRFHGIVIRMFAEAGARHHRPHFHAYYQGAVGIFAVDSVQLLAGSLPVAQRRLVLRWAEIHQGELLHDWERLRAGQPALPIEALN